MARPTLFTHPKFFRLAALVGGRAVALGSLELIWSAAYASGDAVIGDADTLEAVADWRGVGGGLAEALVVSGFVDQVDGELAVHDLYDHAPDYVRKRRAREEARRARGAAVRDMGEGDRSVTGQGRTVTAVVRPPAPAPAPAPAPKDPESREVAKPPALPKSAIPSGTPAAGLDFPVVGDADRAGYQVTEEQIAEWSQAFPGLDVRGECTKALSWVKASPRNRKTAGGMGRFLFGWLGRAQDRGGPRAVGQVAIGNQKRAQEQRRDDPYCEAHSSHGKNLPATKPSFRPRPGCPGCQEYNARHRGRSGEPEQLGDLLPAWAQPNGGKTT
jgi:hypothetical protein